MGVPALGFNFDKGTRIATTDTSPIANTVLPTTIHAGPEVGLLCLCVVAMVKGRSWV